MRLAPFRAEALLGLTPTSPRRSAAHLPAAGRQSSPHRCDIFSCSSGSGQGHGLEFNVERSSASPDMRRLVKGCSRGPTVAAHLRARGRVLREPPLLKLLLGARVALYQPRSRATRADTRGGPHRAREPWVALPGSVPSRSGPLSGGDGHWVEAHLRGRRAASAPPAPTS